jgi:hypothetical protein
MSTESRDIPVGQRVARVPECSESLARAAQSSTNSYVTGDDNLGHEKYCLETAESYRPEVIDNSEPTSLSVGGLETSSNGDY